jgi:iron complex transport system ATP-binding protein
VGLVPQDETIPFELRVTDYVLLGRAPHLAPLEPPDAKDYAIGEKALRTVGLTDLQSRPVTTLSGGERRLAMIARALAQRPQLLLMDEPTTHLDLGNRSRLLGLMQALVAQDVTIVFSTHDPNVAAACAGHMVLLNQGKVLATGSPSAVLTPPLLSRLYEVNVEVAEIRGRPVVTVNGFADPVVAR